MLDSKLLSPHKRLDQIAEGLWDGKNMVVKWGERGPHVKALQKGLNILRQYRPRRDWPIIKDNGDFCNDTFAAVKACQDYLNRVDRRDSHNVAKFMGAAPGTRAYKAYYYDHRFRVKSDGIPGKMTIFEMDQQLNIKGY